MTDFLIRTFLYTLLPLLATGLIIRWDRSVTSRLRRTEVLLVQLFALGVAGGGIGGFFGHIFLSDLVARSIGWPEGSPFQLEMGFANLALGALGLVAVGRRDGFREATVLAVTIIGVGATLVHFVDIVQHGNLAPGNTLVNIGNLGKPLLLILALRAGRRAEQTAHDPDFAAWQQRQGEAAGRLVVLAAAGYGLGYAIGSPVAGSAVGVLAGAIAVAAHLRQTVPTAPHVP